MNDLLCSLPDPGVCVLPILEAFEVQGGGGQVTPAHSAAKWQSWGLQWQCCCCNSHAIAQWWMRFVKYLVELAWESFEVIMVTAFIVMPT